MGRALLIIIFGCSILTSILLVNLNSNASQGLDYTLNFYNNTTARLISNSGVEIYLEKMRQNKTLKGTFLNQSLRGGTYNVYIYGHDTLMNVKSVATYAGETHTTMVQVRRKTVDLPGVKSSLYISTVGSGAKVSGSITIDGHDKNMDGTEGTGTDLPGIGVDTQGELDAINASVNKTGGKSPNVLGTPPTALVTDNTDWKSITENFIFAADRVINTTETISNENLGTKAAPIITYCAGDVHITGGTGYGILIVNGDLKLNGNFRFYGLIICYGNSTIETIDPVEATINGTSDLYGATIVVGNSVEFKGTGNALVQYSTQALANAKNNIKSSRFEVLNWWE